MHIYSDPNIIQRFQVKPHYNSYSALQSDVHFIPVLQAQTFTLAMDMVVQAGFIGFAPHCT